MGAYSDLVVVNNDGPGNKAAVAWPGGIGTLIAQAGTWGGGSVKLQILLPDGSTWADLTDVVLSANGAVGFECGRASLRAVVATATGVRAKLAGVSPAW